LINDNNLTHVYKYIHPNTTPMKYTYWDYKTKARERNVGWHIDYFLVT